MNEDLNALLVEADRLSSQGQAARAKALCERILARDPRQPRALHLLGVLAYQAGDAGTAIDLIGRAISLSGQVPDYYVNRGAALLAAGMADAAIEHFRAALALKPGLAQAHLNIGAAQAKQRKLAEAAESFREAIRIAPSLAVAHFNLAAVEQARGNYRAAIESYRATTRLQPNRFDAYYLMTKSAKMAEQGEEIARELLAALRRGGVDDRNAILCHYSLGKIYNDLRDYASAFKHYQLANSLERKYASFDRSAHAAYVDWAIQTFTPEFFAARRHFGSPSERPIFIVGMPRSGTTLVEQIVASHSRVYGAGELEYWMREYHGRYRERFATLTPEYVNGTAARYLEYLAKLSASAEFVTDKMPHNFLYLGFIHLALPHARIIHCQRNPADSCLSIYFQTFTAAHAYATDLDDLAYYYRAYDRLMDHWRRVLPAGTFQDVRYEALVADSERVIRRMIERLGLDWEDRCLDFDKNEREVRTISDWQVRQPIYRGSLARWRNYEPYIAPLLPLAEEYDRATT